MKSCKSFIYKLKRTYYMLPRREVVHTAHGHGVSETQTRNRKRYSNRSTRSLTHWLWIMTTEEDLLYICAL